MLSLQRDVIEFWYGGNHAVKGDGAIARDQGELWWKKQDDTDTLIQERFGPLVERALMGELTDWSVAPEGQLARIIVLDQFTRNIFRGDKRSYAGDAQALAIVTSGLDAGTDQELRPIYRATFYMPLMHAEDRALQDRCVSLFEALAPQVPEPERSPFESYADYARKHRDIVVRFGRFPHRNELLGRGSTREEVEFLKEPGSSF